MLHFSEPLIRGVSGLSGGFRELSRGFPGDPPHLGGSRGGSPRTPRGYPPDWRSGGGPFFGISGVPRGGPREDPGNRRFPGFLRFPVRDRFLRFFAFFAKIRDPGVFCDFLGFLDFSGFLQNSGSRVFVILPGWSGHGTKKCAHFFVT